MTRCPMDRGLSRIDPMSSSNVSSSTIRPRDQRCSPGEARTFAVTGRLADPSQPGTLTLKYAGVLGCCELTTHISPHGKAGEEMG